MHHKHLLSMDEARKTRCPKCGADAFVLREPKTHEIRIEIRDQTARLMPLRVLSTVRIMCGECKAQWADLRSLIEAAQL